VRSDGPGRRLFSESVLNIVFDVERWPLASVVNRQISLEVAARSLFGLFIGDVKVSGNGDYPGTFSGVHIGRTYRGLKPYESDSDSAGECRRAGTYRHNLGPPAEIALYG